MNLQTILQYKYFKLVFKSVLWVLLFCSCNISKYVPENDSLVKKIEIKFNNETNEDVESLIDKDQLYSIIKQKPNRKVFSKFRFHLRLYNLSNKERIEKNVIKKQKKADVANSKIKLKNEKKLLKDSSAKLDLYKERQLTIGEKIQRVGEQPVVLNDLLTNSSKVQIRNYLFNKGFFNSKITDSLIKLRNSQVAVVYEISPGKISTIYDVSYSCSDSVIDRYIDTIKQNSLIKIGDQYDTELLNQERNKVTRLLQNSGFYSFNKEFIYYEIDTFNLENKVNLVFGIQNYKKYDKIREELTELPHQQFKMNKVYVRINSSDNKLLSDCKDTLKTKTLEIYNCQKINYQKRILKNSINFNKDTYYRKDDALETYKRLIGLGLFKSVSLNFNTIGNNRLNGFIDLVPNKTQSFGVSIDGTNSEGIYGTEGSISYNHNNLFHGGENFLFSFTGGLETQLLYSGDSISTNNSFNTLEIGPKFQLIIPKYFLINKFKKIKSHLNSKTEITASVNYQRRPDFLRWNQEFSFGWVFHEKKSITWHINPLLISAVDIDLDPSYQEQINSLNDQFIATSFLDHIVAGGLFSFEYNSQKLNRFKNEFYAKASFETAGGSLFRYHEITGKQKDNLTNSYYDLFNIRYSHFQKISIDLRYYQPVFLKSKFVYRFFGGIGIPKANQIEALPFEKSFFSGGSNGMRAWKVRSIGPGNYLDSSFRFDKIGDVKLEANIEARFPISDLIEGALFVDMGNVWLLKYDSLRANGQFKWDGFIDQIAFGGGFGIRLNLDFFIIRADIAIPLKNPSIPIDDPNCDLKSRWIFDGKYQDRKYFHPIQFNLGIGYPF